METSKEINPELLKMYSYWSDRAKTLDQMEQIEKVWALQWKFKYNALRVAGFGRIASFIMMLKCVK